MNDNKEITGTHAAFAELLKKRGLGAVTGIHKDVLSTYRQKLKKGINISIDKKEEVLLKAGALVVQEKVWRLK